MTQTPERFTEKDMMELLRSAGWTQNVNGLWVDPDRPQVSMSLRTAYYSQVRRKGVSPRYVHIKK
jgi:hypothetical protein